MDNNDILRRVRYIFNLNDTKMMMIFGLAGHPVTRAEVSDWLKQEEMPAFKKCNDKMLALFLNGLINMKRGQKTGPQPLPEKSLNNNQVLRKLKIALNLQGGEILALMDLADFPVSQHELSAFFRKPGHKHYRRCHDQFLRYFLQGVQLKYRP